MARPSKLIVVMAMLLSERSESITTMTLGIVRPSTFSRIVGPDADKRVVLRCRVGRAAPTELLDKLKRCSAAIEARYWAHTISRRFAANVHEVHLMYRRYVRTYLQAQNATIIRKATLAGPCNLTLSLSSSQPRCHCRLLQEQECAITSLMHLSYVARCRLVDQVVG